MIRKLKYADHDEWLKLRSGYIGGSDAAAVVGLNRFSTPFSLWCEKTGKTLPFGGNLATEVGSYLEEFVAKKFAEESGKSVRRRNVSFVNDKYPWAIANIDREIVGEDAGLEIKTTSALNLRSFKGGEYPDNYYVQCVHYLAVTERKKWYLAVLIGNSEFRIFEIERDEDEIAALMQAEKEFWELVTSGTPPRVDGEQSTTSALSEAFHASDDTVSLCEDDATAAEYASLSAQIKALEKLRDEIANIIKSHMEEASEGYTAKYKITWREQTRSSFDSKRFISDHPDTDLSRYYKTSVSRVFRLTERK